MSRNNNIDFTGAHHGSQAVITNIHGEGLCLNGSLMRHRNAICLEICDPEGFPFVRMQMTGEQLARLLTTNTHVDVTLEQYRDADGKIVKEFVPDPLDVRERMEVRFAKRDAEIMNQLTGIEEQLADGKMGKRKAKILMDELDTVKRNLVANRDFTVQQGVEEVEEIAETVITQVTAAANTLGIDSTTIANALIPKRSGSRKFQINVYITERDHTLTDNPFREKLYFRYNAYADDQEEVEQSAQILKGGKDYRVEVVEVPLNDLVLPGAEQTMLEGKGDEQ